MIRYLIALLLALHGLINVMGFGATSGLGKLPVSQTPQLLPALTPGGAIDRILGVLSLLAAIGFFAGADRRADPYRRDLWSHHSRN